MTEAVIKALKKKTLRERLAKFMAQQCFRNTELEGIHSGSWPKECSRINQVEMMRLNIEMTDKVSAFLSMLVDPKHADTVLDGFNEVDLVPDWEQPARVNIHKRSSG